MSYQSKPESIRSIIEQAKNCWIEGKADTLASLFTEDGELIVPGNRWVGKEAIRKAAADFASNTASVKIEIHQIIIEGNHTAVEWYWEDTAKGTGQKNPADDAIVIDFVGDKIKRWREYIDTQTPKTQSNKG
ncbi:nuclear transport factor 2 family protein [Chroococcus sp. FPU101]|uniref:nuclear transport factor 2 family protein n=1 Tax=Chroococcus sp. FPU101 TaxID=1974212 RepID=UPI001AA643A3|nr:nuclear transport factor 2 family protein [Chroococcus sp. FPU101]GFE72287.1 unknown protein [Chroococcus sp. FPU101]